MINVQRIIQDPFGSIKKDDRMFHFEEKLFLGDQDNPKRWEYDLTSAIEHVGGPGGGHYFCAKRSWISIKPMIKQRSKGDNLFKFLNWNLISDNSKFRI